MMKEIKSKMKAKQFIEKIKECDELQVNYRDKRGIYHRPIDFAAIIGWRDNVFDLLIRVSYVFDYNHLLLDKNLPVAKAIREIDVSFDDRQRYIKKEKEIFLKDAEVFILYHAKLYPIHKMDIIQSNNKKIAVVEFVSFSYNANCKTKE